MSEIVYKIPKEKRLSGFDFQAFQEWADKRYNPDRLSINVFHMARNASGDNVNALNKWFEWYDEFRNNWDKTEQNFYSRPQKAAAAEKNVRWLDCNSNDLIIINKLQRKMDV